MMQIPVRNIRTIPISTLIISDVKVRKLAEQYQEGKAMPKAISVARLPDRTAYIINGLDTLEAARQAGMETIPCITVDVETYKEALELHLDAVKSLPHDPFAVLDAINEIRKTDPGYEFPNEEYARLNELCISGEAKRTFRKMLVEISNENKSIPSFWHIFLPLSQLDQSEQAGAINTVMNFTKIQGTAPDTGSLKGNFRQFAITEKEEKPKTVEILPTEEETTQIEDSVAGSEIAGVIHDPENHMVSLTCKCGITLYYGDTGRPVYTVSHDYASYLGIDVRASTFYKRLGDAENPFVVISAEPLDDEKAAALNEILKE